MTSKSVLALAAILALSSLSLATEASAAHGGGGGGHGGGGPGGGAVGGGGATRGGGGQGRGGAHGGVGGAGMEGGWGSSLECAGVYSSGVDTGPISGTAVGGITASDRAGYGPTITASTCGPAIKVLPRRFASFAA